MAQIILLRHGQSLWNAVNKFTGWVDVPLSKRGRTEAMSAACKLRDYRVDICFTSRLIRAIETAIICLTEYTEICGGKTPIIKHVTDALDWHGWDKYEGNPDEELPIVPSQALDERCYGYLQGLNKAQIAEKFGQELVRQWRRSYSVKPPGGESLEDTKNRVISYYRSRMLSYVKQGHTLLVVAHGNTLRAFIMELEGLSEEEIPGLELTTGVPIVYNLDEEANVIGKIILNY